MQTNRSSARLTERERERESGGELKGRQICWQRERITGGV